MFHVRRSRTLSELALASAAIGAYNFASIGVFSLVPLIRSTLHLSEIEIGLLASTQFFVAAAWTFPAARLTERIQPSRVVAISQFVVVGAMVVAATAPSLPLFLLASALLGVSSGLVNPVTNVLSAANVSLRRRAMAMSIKQTGVTIGGGAAGLILPAIAAATDWRNAVLVPAVLTAAVGTWGLLLDTGQTAKRIVLRDSGPLPSRVRLGAFGFAMSGVQLAVFGYVAVYLVDERRYSAVSAGVALAVALAAGGAGRLLWGWFSDRFHARIPILMIVAIGSAGALSLLPLVGQRELWPVVVAIGVCSVGWNGVYHTAVAESAGPAGIAHATAFTFMFLYAGSIVVPPLLGFAVEKLSWSAFWWIGGGAAFASALAIAHRARVKPEAVDSSVAQVTHP